MRVILLLALTLAAIPVTFAAEPPPAEAAVLQATFQPRAVTGTRGQKVDLVARLVQVGGPAVANAPVRFSWRSDATGWRPLGTVFTGPRGYARWRGFKIPTNPAHDNVRIRVEHPAPGYVSIFGYTSTVWRISITR